MLNGECKDLSSVHWTHWWVGFMKPFNDIFNILARGISDGQDYNSRKPAFLACGEKFMIPRKISEKDLIVIKEVSESGKEEHVAALIAKGKRVMDHWTPILSDFFSNDEPVRISNKKRKLKATAECSSYVDKTPISGTEGTHMTENSSLEEESTPATKRKLDTMDTESNYGPIELDVPLNVDNISGVDLDGVLCGGIDHGLGDLDDLNIDDYVGTESLEASELCPGLSTNTSPVDDDSTISPAFAHGTEDVPVVDKELLVKTAVPTMDIITEFFVNATESALKAALDGLDASTIVEPRRQAILQDLLRMIPSIPQFASVREAVDMLISISVGMQEANGGVGAVSAKQAQAIVKAESEVALHENALKDTSDKLLSAIEQNDERKRVVAPLSFKLNEATSHYLGVKRRLHG
uniref:Uncharacterized protein n=1 Tax=Hordeum vulgare subsp. vulgare TaxID=112509 RepID=A0A8I6WRW8_HORVV